MISGTVGHYQVLDELGSGGMGVVYRARDTRLRRDVALKVLRHDAPWPAEARERLLHEARAISALSHPNICAVHEVGEHEGQTFIVMELVSGTPLGLRLKSTGGVDPETVTRWGIQLADALDHAHRQGVVHRDLKPSNVVIAPDGRLKIVDFGIAMRALRDPEESTVFEPGGAVAGTPPYMAPEVIRGGNADARSDIWSLGVLLHESLSGTRPFQGPTPHEITAAILRDPPQALPAHVPPDLAAIVGRCLPKDPAARYQHAGEVRAALEAVQGRASPRMTTRAKWGAAAAVGLTILALLGVAGRPGWMPDWIGSRGVPAAAPDAVPAIRGLAVLPLRNLGDDPRQDYFADGLTAALITELARVERLTVISQTSVMRYRDVGNRSLPQIGRELGVDALIEGSVLRDRDRVRISIDLIHAGTDRHLWAESYERPLQDVLTLQAEIARAVVAHVQTRLGPGGDVNPLKAPKVNSQAYESYLRARFEATELNPAALGRAIEHYKQAIALDPGFAPAHAGLARAWFHQRFWGEDAPPMQAIEIKQAARTALTLDSNLAEAHEALGRALMEYDWDYSGAESAYRRAIELSPSLATAHEGYAFLLTALARPDEAVAEAGRAVALDPQSAYMLDAEGRALYRARRYREAEERYRRALALDPGQQTSLSRLAELYIVQRRFGEAKATLDRLERLPSLTPFRLTTPRAMLEAVSGHEQEARRLVPMLSSRHSARARVYIVLGDYDRAFADLESAMASRQLPPYMFANPEMDPLRMDPRFARLLQRMGLPVDRVIALGALPIR